MSLGERCVAYCKILKPCPSSDSDLFYEVEDDYLQGASSTNLFGKFQGKFGAMNAAFEAVVWDDLGISTGRGTLLVPHGLYIVTIGHNQRGDRTGALLFRIDVQGEQPIRVTEPELELLDGMPYFERR